MSSRGFRSAVYEVSNVPHEPEVLQSVIVESKFADSFTLKVLKPLPITVLQCFGSYGLSLKLPDVASFEWPF